MERWKQIQRKITFDRERSKLILEKVARNLSLYITAFLPEPFGCRMQRHFEMAFGSIAHHLCERQWGVLRPGNAIFARLQRPAKIRDKWVGGVLMGVDRPAAEIEGRNIAGKFRKVRSLDQPFAQTDYFQALQKVLVQS